MGYSIRTNTYRYTRWVEWPNRKLMAEELYDYNSESSTVRNNVFFMEKENVFQNPAYVETKVLLRKRMDQVLIERRPHSLESAL